ncbi:MAG: M20/M25/M40 family metallo-hydrolase [Pseudomonadota bacterium]|nr:M20/M25/M40 family metallo-hydrolase [Pseudomonadota bacterium]
MNIFRIILITLLALPVSAKVDSVGYYIIEKQFLVLVPNAKNKVIEELGTKVVVKLSADERDNLVEKIHDVSKFCGGVIDVTEDYSKKPKGFLKEYTKAAPVRLFKETYSINFDKQVKTILGTVSSDRFDQYIRKFIAFPDRYSNSENGKKAHEFLRDSMKEIAKNHNRSDVTVIEVETGTGYTQNSIVVKVPGKNSSLPAVLIGGHMDTLRNNKPGADDDASGTVAVAEIYQSVLDTGLKFNRDIYFVYYAAEEVGLVGSSYVAKKFQKENIELRGVLQFDMIGYKSEDETNTISFVEDNVDDSLTDFVKSLATHYLGINKNEMGKTLCNYECSDHASWNRLGYATAFPFEAGMDTMNRDLHTARDTMEKVDLNHAIKFIKLGAAFVVEMAEPVN